MNELIQKLLQPVSAEQPCGPDLSNDAKFDELETLLKGKPEVEIGTIKKPAEPPEWREVKDKTAAFLAQSKHLRVAMMHCCSLLRTAGVPGFRDGLQLVSGLVQQYWAALYPLLDPEDNNDPTQRLNTLAALTAARGSVSGWLTITDYLYTAPAFQTRGMPPITFDQILAAKQKAADGTAAPDAPDPVKLGAAIRAASEQLAAQQQALRESIETLHGLDQFLTTTLGATNTISFEVLDKLLQELLGAIEPYTAGATVEAGATTTTDAGGASGAESAAAITIHGSIRSRDDVVRALDNICEYYQQVEPSSPVPYLLRRAQKLAIMDFIQAVQELNLTTMDGLRPSMGSALDAAAPPPPAA